MPNLHGKTFLPNAYNPVDIEEINCNTTNLRKIISWTNSMDNIITKSDVIKAILDDTNISGRYHYSCRDSWTEDAKDYYLVVEEKIILWDEANNKYYELIK